MTESGDEVAPLFSVTTGELLPPPQPDEAMAYVRIGRTALRLFAERGYSAVTIVDIADACQLSKGSLYWHYTSKEDLFRKVVAEYLESWERRVMEAVVTASTWDEQLAAVFRIFIEVLEDADDPHRDLLFLMTLRGAGGPGQHDLGSASLQRFAEWIHAVLSTHPDHGHRDDYAALVHAAGLGVLSEAAFGFSVARPVLSAVLDVLGGQPLESDRNLRGRRTRIRRAERHRKSRDSVSVGDTHIENGQVRLDR